MIEIKDSLILSDNNEYVVASKTDYNDNTYLYLVDINNNTNIKFCRLDNDRVIEIKDEKLLKKLAPLFYKASRHLLNEFINQ